MAKSTNTWTVDSTIPAITTAEVLGRYNTLVVVAVNDHDEFVRPLEREWRTGAQADVLSMQQHGGGADSAAPRGQRWRLRDG